jgi:pimeloyl-ACP methyl ester carboxylesterase
MPALGLPSRNGSRTSADELPLFFESSSYPLYGVFHTPEAGRSTDRVVVFCHSLGVEHMASQRMEVLGARMAAKAGFAAFRYDSRGHGDSGGDPENVSFRDLVTDACAAANYARSLSGASKVIWVGVRFGCLTAAAAISSRDDAAALSLWEPLHTGDEYFRAAIRTTLFCNVAQGKRSGGSVDDLLLRLQEGGVVPVIGTYLYNALRSSALNIDLGESLKDWSGDTLIAQVQRRSVLSGSSQRLHLELQQRGARTTVILIKQEPSWSMLPLVRPQWTNDNLIDATREWFRGLA